VTDAGAQPVRGDLAELSGRNDSAVPPKWLDHLHEVDAVVHAAARMEFWGPDAGFRADNYEPTVALHAAAAQAGVSRFVLISAAGVSMGSQRAAVVDENTDNGTPNIAYCRVKLATENALRNPATPGMTLVILRPPFIWGPGITTIAEAVDAANKGQWMWIDDGRHIMDFVHVDNLADAVVLALTHGRHGAPYYVTDGTPMPIRDFFTALLATQGVDVFGSRSVPLAVAAPIAAVMDGAARSADAPRHRSTTGSSPAWAATAPTTSVPPAPTSATDRESASTPAYSRWHARASSLQATPSFPPWNLPGDGARFVGSQRGGMSVCHRPCRERMGLVVRALRPT
jgi:nucleoside-diphosphate-sugar epimerase